jgi:phosphoglycolate phosphatase
VGNGVERFVKRALIGGLEGEPDTALFERAMPLFRELYAANTCRYSRLYPGILEGLGDLQTAGIHLACITNKAELFTHRLLKEIGILDRFEVVVSGDTLAQKKPHPAPLLYAADQLLATAGVENSGSGADDAAVLMVGDSKNDVAAARAACFPVVCVSYGYNHGEDIRASQPDAVIDSLADLSSLFE